MDEKSEAALVAGLRAGDPRAFKQAYDRYKCDVIALAATMLGRQDGAWDVLHDVFVSFARRARGLDPKSNVKAYLLTAAANRVRDVLAKRKETSTGWDEASELRCSKSEDPSVLAANEDEWELLRQSVLALPVEQRVVIALRVYGGLSFREIGEQEQISENTAQSRYRYGIEKLRRKHAGTQ